MDDKDKISLIAKLLEDHKRIYPHHSHLCELCKEAEAAIAAPAAPLPAQPEQLTPRDMAIAQAVRQACVNAYTPDTSVNDWSEAIADIDLAGVIRHAAPLPAQPQQIQRPTDDALWDQTLGERDIYHDWADKLAEGIAKHLDVEIGEHSNQNCPWAEALEAIEAAAPAASPVPAPVAVSECALADENRTLSEKLNDYRDRLTESEESRHELVRLLNEEAGGRTFMGGLFCTQASTRW